VPSFFFFLPTLLQPAHTTPSSSNPPSLSAPSTQAVIFEVGDRDLIGHPTPAGYRYCCTKDLVSKTKCHQDRLIYQRKADGWPKVLDIYFENNATTAYAWEEAITIDKSGMYYLWFVTCDDDLSAVTVAGATEWKNPTGYLPGAMIPLVSLHAVAAAAYGALLLAWGVSAARHAADVGFLQRAVGGVIALGAAEAITWACDYAHFNATGHRPPASTLYAVLVGCGRRTLARYVALVVSLGAGVVVPVLAPVLRHKVAALCVTYVLASGAASGLASVGQVDDLTGGARALLGLPVAALDAVFVLWIFSALSRTLAQVAARRAAAKLDLYRKFTNLLAVMVWASVAWIAYETYYKVRQGKGKRENARRERGAWGEDENDSPTKKPSPTPLSLSRPLSLRSLTPTTSAGGLTGSPALSGWPSTLPSRPPSPSCSGPRPRPRALPTLTLTRPRPRATPSTRPWRRAAWRPRRRGACPSPGRPRSRRARRAVAVAGTAPTPRRPPRWSEKRKRLQMFGCAGESA